MRRYPLFHWQILTSIVDLRALLGNLLEYREIFCFYKGLLQECLASLYRCGIFCIQLAYQQRILKCTGKCGIILGRFVDDKEQPVKLEEIQYQLVAVDICREKLQLAGKQVNIVRPTQIQLLQLDLLICQVNRPVRPIYAG